MSYFNSISPATACFPGTTIDIALKFLHKYNPIDYCIDSWNFSNIQICPQHIGKLSVDTFERIIDRYPKIKFRLHANVRLEEKLRPFDAGFSLSENISYIKKLKKIQKILNSKVYSYHAPMHQNKEFSQIFYNVLTLQDYLQIPVALEGLYSNFKNKEWLWNNPYYAYNKIYKEKIFFALDLSHLNICYYQSDEQTKLNIIKLTEDMIQSPYCLEIHISANDGKNDTHKNISESIWWIDILNRTEINPNCVIFCESLQKK